MTVQIKKNPKGCYAILHSASEAEDDSMGKKRRRKKKRLVVVALFTQFQHLIFRLYDLSLRIFFFLQGAVKSIFVTTLVTPYHPLSADRRPFFSLPFPSLYNIH